MKIRNWYSKILILDFLEYNKTFNSLRFSSLYIILIFVINLIIAGCEKSENIQFTDSPIITSYLHPESYFFVNIAHQVPFVSNVEYADDDINNLSIIVSSNDTIYMLKPAGDGNYIDSSLIVTEGDVYDLSFAFNQKEVSAYTYIPSKPVDVTQSTTQISIERMDSTFIPSPGSMPDPIEIIWNNDDQSYYLLVIENTETELDPIRDFGDDDAPERLFRNAPTNSSSVEIRANDFQYYGYHRVILYHVLPDYASLYESTNNSSLNLTNPSTSIKNGYGIFTGLNSDTLFINVKEG